MGRMVVAFIGIGLRIFAFICLLIALVVIATDKLVLIEGSESTFNDIQGYRYVLAVAIIGLVHTILQLGFSIYYAVTKNIPFWKGLPQFNYYTDQVISWVLASAAGAGLAVSADRKMLLNEVVETGIGDCGVLFAALDQQKWLVDDFFDRANIASAILFLAFLSIATILLLSPFNRIEPIPTTQDLEAQSPQAQNGKAQSPQAQTVEAQSPHAHTVEAHSPQAQSPRAQQVDAHSPQAQKVEAQPTETSST
ncbi:CASP-like protein 4D1 [Cucurbita moschata]|uniref:CASP-like protein n=1 Tax=Cucurbita moschata TaxID=3662 RepID=A0A6J1GBH8_CUCMO|nr:CASP-like protein 4D1 [Cucurbita moschata]